jgi:hypothetical protein
MNTSSSWNLNISLGQRQKQKLSLGENREGIYYYIQREYKFLGWFFHYTYFTLKKNYQKIN